MANIFDVWFANLHSHLRVPLLSPTLEANYHVSKSLRVIFAYFVVFPP